MRKDVKVQKDDAYDEGGEQRIKRGDARAKRIIDLVKIPGEDHLAPAKEYGA